ncbi:hypothetical protein LSM04_008340 [Trypanosoma melophagium]|uniref:uncharacterized protein n=1 Tax=Trypanosoma melophagium TaxID=715481 RepID=UPI00351A1F2E|nr:hypothetical protein LSM04_008340 [Trypanosoma melophagium]
MSQTNRRSSSGEDSDDALEHCGLTATRRTWPAPNHEIEIKRNDKMMIMTSLDSSNEMHTSSALTATNSTNSTTPQHTTVTWISPMTSDSLHVQLQRHQSYQSHQEESFLQRKRQSSEMSIDLVWGEEGEEEGRNNTTPSSVLTRAPRQTGWSDSSSPATVRRRLSLQEGSRRSGTLPAISLTTTLTAAQQEEVTPTPLRRMPHLLQQPHLQPLEPATESRELPVRPGYTIPSPGTPLWPALEEEEDDEEEEGENNNNNNNNNMTEVREQNTVEGVREDVDMDTDAIMRLPLSRRPSSFAHRVAPSSVSSVSVSPPSVVVASSQEARRLFTTGNNLNGNNGNDLGNLANYHKSGSEDPVVHDTVPMSQKSQRKAEEALRKIKADAWAEEMRRFFEVIDQRPLLAVTVDEP